MYARDNIAGRDEPLTFGVSGKLLMNALVMYDRETDSLWSQLLGRAVKGEYDGVNLTALPVTQTTWRRWRQEHPESLALRTENSGASDQYAGYYQGGQAGVFGERHRDSRLSPRNLGLGVVHAGQPAYYPFGVLRQQPVVNDTIAGEPILVVFAQNVGGTAFVYRRHVEGRTLTFENVNGTDESSAATMLRDIESGTLWDGWRGVATEGLYAGTRLERLPATTAFWFAWSDYYPHTALYGSNDDAR